MYWPFLIGSEQEAVRLVDAFEAGHTAGINLKKALECDTPCPTRRRILAPHTGTGSTLHVDYCNTRSRPMFRQ
eukprot:1196051-Prorocentrum_minimum.AAC.6